MVPSNLRNVSPRGMRNSWHPTGTRCGASLISSSIFNNNQQEEEEDTANKRSSWDGATTVSRKTAGTTRKYSQTIGSTIPSDHAFADVILDRLDDTRLSNPADFELRNVRRSSKTEGGELWIINEHRLSYRDQVIFDYSTTRCCDGVNTYGQTSTCSVRNGCLRIKCADKTTNNDRTSINTKHFNPSWESFDFPLEELVRRSALQRQSEMTMHLDNRRHTITIRGI